MKTVLIKRDRKNKIIYHSGTIKTDDDLNIDGFEIYKVGRQKKPKKPGEGLYCPYCQTWNKWIKIEGFKLCPICYMGINDYYVQTYNNLWGSRR